jgi:Domain of unknown function (DUF5606)
MTINYPKKYIFAPLLNKIMEYREIVAVTGLGGLYQLLTTKSDGAIVRNVADKTTKFISARQHNVTPLESIEVYTTGENVRLQEVFKKMLESESSTPPADPKTTDDKGIKLYFKSIFPEFDDDRVYVSDMKKMLKWFELLKANDLLRFEEPVEETPEEAETPAEAPAAEESAAVEEKPKKAAKKNKAETTDEPAADGDAEKPAKKTARKKKTEE